MYNSIRKRISCYQAQHLMDAYIADDPSLTNHKYQAFESHLQFCSKCAQQYQESKLVIDLVKEYGQVSEETIELIERTSPRITIEEGWKDLCRRCPDIAESAEKSKSFPLLLRIGAVAACLVIGILTWMKLSNYLMPQTLSQNSSSRQVTSVPKASVKVELVKPSGNIIIATDQKIFTHNHLKILLINGKHQMTMNKNTVLAIEPLVENSHIGCLVKLDSGQIYTHVEHDGNPFAINTIHGQAVITGTTFDIKVMEDSTALVVCEGTVRFKSEKGFVNVVAGQTSKIVGQSAPSTPVSCYEAELTTWATGYKSGPVLAKAELNPDPWDLLLSFVEKPIVLAETDYNQWIEQKRNWFKKDFPWIFELKDALVEEGFEVDYPELLIKSGNVWQFIYSQKYPARFSVPDFDSLLKTAISYGFDEEWLLENVPAAESALEKSMLPGNALTSLKAFEQWLDKTKGPEVRAPIYSYYAGKYLTETRSLIWFAVRNGQYNLTEKERTEILDLLQEEVAIACQCQNDAIYSTDKQQKQSCNEEMHQETTDSITGYIEIIKIIEHRLVTVTTITSVPKKSR